ncbi:MAG: DUF975 family protein [Fibrobacter sp.]|nr:DUF975 family protein [Fibrobacter sp.]
MDQNENNEINENIERDEQLQMAVEELNANRPIDTIGCKQYAWGAMEGNWRCGAMVLVMCLLLGVLLASPLFVLEEGTGLYIAWDWISSLLCWVVSLGALANFLDIARGKKPGLARIFVGFQSVEFCFRYLGMVILRAIFVILWSLLLIIPGLMKMYSYTMSQWILLDHPEYSPRQAITASKKMMVGHRLELVMLQARFLGWFLLCLVTFGIASFWVTPYYYAAKGKFYMDLLARNETEKA